MAQSQVRQRKKSTKKQPKATKHKSDDKSTEPPSTAAGATRDTNTEQDGDETLWQTFVNHPLVIAGIIVLIPYAVYRTYYFVSLQRPELLHTATLGLISLRPAVQLTDPRQVLIVGSMGSGTQQVASGLAQILDLEVLHETVNAQAYHVRDGTVSNFLGLRYLPRPNNTATYVKTVANMCIDTGGVGLHPRQFRQTNCSEYQKWSGCWSRACIQMVDENWACALAAKEEEEPPHQSPSDNNKNSDNDSEFASLSPSAAKCHHPPFETVLHIVQHPIRTIQELMAKVCPKPTMAPHPAFRQLAQPYLIAVASNEENNNMTCLHQVSWYVIRFNQALIQAHEAGLVQARFHYEDTTLCDIVQRAGFLDRDGDESTTKNMYKKLNQRCKGDAHAAAAGGGDEARDDATQRLPLLESRDDQLRTLPNYTWDDFQQAGTGGTALVQALRDLCTLLGYSPDDWYWMTHPVPNEEEKVKRKKNAKNPRPEEPIEVY